MDQRPALCESEEEGRVNLFYPVPNKEHFRLALRSVVSWKNRLHGNSVPFVLSHIPVPSRCLRFSFILLSLVHIYCFCLGEKINFRDKPFFVKRQFTLTQNIINTFSSSFFAKSSYFLSYLLTTYSFHRSSTLELRGSRAVLFFSPLPANDFSISRFFSNRSFSSSIIVHWSSNVHRCVEWWKNMRNNKSQSVAG